MSGAKRTAGVRGFTLVEAIVVIIILGILATIVAPRVLQNIGRGRESAAAANATNLASAVRMFWADCGPPPAGSTLTILRERPGDIDASKWKGPYVDNAEALMDPWGVMFVLVVPGQKNVDFDIVSYGADKAPGGEGENADIIKP